MQNKLAMSLLAEVLGWDTDEITREVPPLLAIAYAKYDQYYQYRPGMRFVESLALWLSQFDLAERKEAYIFIRDRLIYFSAEEMFHLIQMAIPDHIVPRLIRIVANEDGLPRHMVTRIAASSKFKALQTRTLYLGLSDGSQMGLLRRLNPGVVGHEHTLITYEAPDKRKAQTMLDKHLTKALQDVLGEEHQDEATFRHLVLIDDFTASGISFLRKEPSGNQDSAPELWNGKLAKIFRWIKEDHYRGLLATDNIYISVLYYIATEKALARIRESANQCAKELGINANISIDAVQILKPRLDVRTGDESDLDVLLRKYVKPEDLVDNHWELGQHANPHLGYDECGLPVVIYHNTPNNSLPLLWYSSPSIDGENVLRPLFPRTTRHVKA